jgi:hypothetical protein
MNDRADNAATIPACQSVKATLDWAASGAKAGKMH